MLIYIISRKISLKLKSLMKTEFLLTDMTIISILPLINLKESWLLSSKLNIRNLLNSNLISIIFLNLVTRNKGKFLTLSNNLERVLINSKMTSFLSSLMMAKEFKKRQKSSLNKRK